MSKQWERSNPRSGDEVLIAVSIEKLRDHPLFAPPLGRCKQAVIRGQSSEPSASFIFETGPLIPYDAERFERLLDHGFTVLIPPAEWRYQYSPLRWQNDLIVEALARVANFGLEKRVGKPKGYDCGLAKAVMELLNETYPESSTPLELKYQFKEEPSDEILSTVLNALRGDGYIDGARVLHGESKLSPLERITLTTEGRRHLADEMKKTSKPQQHYSGNGATSFILKKLLAEFRERRLTTTDLHQGYEGFSATKLKELADAIGICDVDFDLALNELEEHHFVKTGPLDVAGGQVNRDVYFMPTIYSRREFLYLTVDGYKEAKLIDSNTQLPEANLTGDGGRTVVLRDQYINYGQAGAIGSHSSGTINYQQQWEAIRNQVDFAKLATQLSALRSELLKSAPVDYVQVGIVAQAEHEAESHNGPGVVKTLSNVARAVFETAERIGTDIAAKVIVEAGKG